MTADADRHHSPIDYRPAELVVAILGTIYEHDGPTPWLDLLDEHTTGRWPWRTVENTLYDLIAHGAVHRVGKPGTSRVPDTRALKPTPLGRAWLEQELAPLPRQTDRHIAQHHRP